jgi:hypothetical protein
MLAIQHCTPYGIFSLELSVSDGFEEAEISLANAQNRDFFDYLVGTDEDFFPMCVLFAKCTEIAATKRKKQLLEKIAELRQNRQDLVDQLKDKNQELTNNNNPPFKVSKISKIRVVIGKQTT